MSISREIDEAQTVTVSRATRNRLPHESEGFRVIPFLRRGLRQNSRHEAQHDQRDTHRWSISRWPVIAATLVAVTGASACEEALAPTDEALPTSELLFLRLQSAAPVPPTETFHVVNSRRVAASLLHPDNFNTLFARVEFDAGSLVELDGSSVGGGDSVLATLEPQSGEYGFTLSPLGMVYSTAPLATLSFGAYGDRSVADGSPTYSDRDAYSEALAVWFEISPGQWERAPQSAAAGIDVIQARMSEPGRYVLAAPR